MEWLLITLAFAAFACYAFVRGHQRARQLQQLLQNGQPAQGAITARRKFSKTGKTGPRFMIVYEYNVDGRVRKHRSHVSREEFDSLHEGQSIAVRFLPAKPSIVAPEFVLAKARAAQENLQRTAANAPSRDSLR